MQALNEYVAQKNRWNAIFGGTPLDLNSAKDRAEIAASIDADLSPENLSCDGEISRAEANRKYKRLSRVARELEAYCASNTLTMPQVYEL
jgi:hypothetical protein